MKISELASCPTVDHRLVAFRKLVGGISKEFLGGEISMVSREHPATRGTLKSTEYSVLSMFAGCGGMDLGFRGGFEYKGELFPKLPFKIIKAYDYEKRAVETYAQNIGPEIEQADLSSLPPASMPKADILMGGFPCQDFSSCGPKRGRKSKRGRLYRALLRYMNHHKPMMVIGENVPNLARMNNGYVLREIKSELETAGYDFNVWSLYAPDFGVPQNRSRLFIVGIRKDLKGFPIQPEADFSERHRSITWAIQDLVAIEDETVPNQSQYFKASKAKKGNGQGDETSRADEPAYTVRANAKSRVQFHYALKRRLTVRECARLQTFPDNFVFPHSATTNIMQIGNAVPPVLAYRVAESIARCVSALPVHQRKLEVKCPD